MSKVRLTTLPLHPVPQRATNLTSDLSTRRPRDALNANATALKAFQVRLRSSGRLTTFQRAQPALKGETQLKALEFGLQASIHAWKPANEACFEPHRHSDHQTSHTAPLSRPTSASKVCWLSGNVSTFTARCSVRFDRTGLLSALQAEQVGKAENTVWEKRNERRRVLSTTQLLQRSKPVSEVTIQPRPSGKPLPNVSKGQDQPLSTFQLTGTATQPTPEPVCQQLFHPQSRVFRRLLNVSGIRTSGFSHWLQKTTKACAGSS